MSNAGRFSTQSPWRWWLVTAVGVLLVTGEHRGQYCLAADTFLVIDKGTALLGPDGAEIERLSKIMNAAGALSPDGKWIAFAEAKMAEDAATPKFELIIQSRIRPEESKTAPLVWGMTGSSLLPLWSPDSKRLLICEQGWNDKVMESVYRIYDLTSERLTEFKLPIQWWPSDWSIDGKRLLTALDRRIAWVSVDGKGEPEYLTSEFEIAYGAKLSPDGSRILCMAGPRRPNEKRNRFRLSVIDLDRKTRKRLIVDEPGETNGYCWSLDSSRIAYTWQPSLENPAEAVTRETFLKTCDYDGTERKIVTSRKIEVPPNHSGRDGTIVFFQVFAWR